METVIPTISIKLLTQQYKLLSLTINPIFFATRNDLIRSPLKSIFLFEKFLPPRREFEVWIELVLAHDSKLALDFPEIRFSFNSALEASDSDFPYREETAGVPFLPCCKNYELYSHFWLNRPSRLDMLKSAYGADATRIVPNNYCPDDPAVADLFQKLSRTQPIEIGPSRFGLAFMRSSYELDPGPQKLNSRLNYPCTFQILSDSASESGARRQVTVLPRPFELGSWQPSYERQQLKKDESISLWFYYRYSQLTAAQADAPDYDQFSFVHEVRLDKEDLHPQMDTNVFPRFPYRFRVLHSSPPLVPSPHLEQDPPPWTRTECQMFPMVIEEEIANSGSKRRGFRSSNEMQEGPVQSSLWRAGVKGATAIVRQLLGRLWPLTERNTLSQTDRLRFFFGMQDERAQTERNVAAVIYSLIIGVLMNYVANVATADKPFDNLLDVAWACMVAWVSGVFTYAAFAATKGRLGGAKAVFFKWEMPPPSTESPSVQIEGARQNLISGTLSVLVAACLLLPGGGDWVHFRLLTATLLFMFVGAASSCYLYWEKEFPYLNSRAKMSFRSETIDRTSV